MLIEVPIDSSDLPAFANALDEARRRYSRRVARSLAPLSSGGGSSGAGVELTTHELSLDPETAALFQGPSASAAKLGLKLAVLGWRRWHLAATSLFLSKTFEQAGRPMNAEGSLRRAVVATLAVYCVLNEDSFKLSIASEWLKGTHNELNFVDDTMLATLTPEKLELAFAILKVESGSIESIQKPMAREWPGGASAAEFPNRCVRRPNIWSRTPSSCTS